MVLVHSWTARVRASAHRCASPGPPSTADPLRNPAAMRRRRVQQLTGGDGVAGPIAVSRSVDRHRPVARLAHQTARQRDHAGDALVLGATVPDEHDGCGSGTAFRRPHDAGDHFAIDRHVEAAFDHPAVDTLAHDLHGSTLALSRCDAI